MMTPFSAPNSMHTQGATISTPSTPNLVSTCGSRYQSASPASTAPTTAGTIQPRIASSCTWRCAPSPAAIFARLAKTKRVASTPMASAVKPTAGMPISEPTERSMPAVMMTAVMPVAIRPVVETCLSTSSRLPDDRKMLLPFELTGDPSTPIRKMAIRPQ